MKLIENLKERTPKPNIIFWILSTIIYIICIIINEYFDLINNVFNFSEKTENIIRLIGITIYVTITTFNFNKKEPDE